MGLFGKKISVDEKYAKKEAFAKTVFPMYDNFRVYYIGDQDFLTLTNHGIWLFTYYNNTWNHNLYPYSDIINYSIQYSQTGNTWKDVVFHINVGNQTIETKARIKAMEQDIVIDLLNQNIHSSNDEQALEGSHGDDEGTDFTWDDLEALKGMNLVNVLPIMDDDGDKVLGVSLLLDHNQEIDSLHSEVSLLHFFDGTIKLFRH
jgi:hypothetical protein